uniref:Uncharacterized protein n=1 Tax=Panagrolaimus sp. JU765 TaxID=591449 RepID=A0AC34RIT0_9BILA
MRVVNTQIGAGVFTNNFLQLIILLYFAVHRLYCFILWLICIIFLYYRVYWLFDQIKSEIYYCMYIHCFLIVIVIRSVSEFNFCSHY